LLSKNKLKKRTATKTAENEIQKYSAENLLFGSPLPLFLIA
jgi:hypothetical protein